MKTLVASSIFLIVLFLSPDILASTDDANNQAYYEGLLVNFTNLILRVALLISLIILLVTGVLYVTKVLDSNAISQRDLKPMTFMKFIGGICLASVLFSPLHTIVALNDLTGMNDSASGLKVCSVVKVDVSHFDWADDASDCMTKMEERLTELAQYKDSDKMEGFNLGLIFGLIQLVSIGFFIASCVTLAQHIWGFRQVKTTVTGALIAIVMSSFVYALPNVVDYVEDMKGSAREQINT